MRGVGASRRVRAGGSLAANAGEAAQPFDLAPATLVRVFAAAVIRWRLTAREADAVLAMAPGDAARVAATDLRPPDWALPRLAALAKLYLGTDGCTCTEAGCAERLRQRCPRLAGRTPLSHLCGHGRIVDPAPPDMGTVATTTRRPR